MGQVTTGYCKACGAQVRIEGEIVAAGGIYCDACRATKPAEQGAPEARRRDAAPPRPRRSASQAPSPRSKAVIAAVAAAVVVIAAGAWYLTRQTGSSSAGQPPQGPAPAPPKAEPPPTATQPPRPTPTPPPKTEPTGPEATPPTPPPKPEPAAHPPGPEGTPPTEAPAGALSPDDLKAIGAAEGKKATVLGVVKRVAIAKSGKVEWITFNDDKNGFEGVIFQKKFEDFTKEFGDLSTTLPGKRVAITGKVSSYQGRLQIILDDPSQLVVK